MTTTLVHSDKFCIDELTTLRLDLITARGVLQATRRGQAKKDTPQARVEVEEAQARMDALLDMLSALSN